MLLLLKSWWQSFAMRETYRRGLAREVGESPTEEILGPEPLGQGEELCREGVEEAVWFGCGFVSFLFHSSRIDNFAYFLVF